MFYNERKEKSREKTLLCPAAAGQIYNENHTVVMGNSSRPSVKENESLAQAALPFMQGLGLVHRIMFQSLHWSVKKGKEIRISRDCFFIFTGKPRTRDRCFISFISCGTTVKHNGENCYLSWCTRSGWDGVNLHSNLYSAMFWICN